MLSRIEKLGLMALLDERIATAEKEEASKKEYLEQCVARGDEGNSHFNEHDNQHSLLYGKTQGMKAIRQIVDSELTHG